MPKKIKDEFLNRFYWDPLDEFNVRDFEISQFSDEIQLCRVEFVQIWHLQTLELINSYQSNSGLPSFYSFVFELRIQFR